jgi:formamidopyrimidine-DNA glycosylase
LPEILEVERYAQLAARTIGRRVAHVDAPDAWYLKHGADANAVQSVATGATVSDVRRIGKLLLLDLVDRPTLGLRFGMTGRLFVDGVAGIDELEYGSSRVEPEWERFRLLFEGDTRLVMHDPRRLGGVEIAPDESRLGPDALSLTLDQLRVALRAGRGPLKARLMDQSRIAGLGNLLTDETLWRARLSPSRRAGDLSDDEMAQLHTSMREVLRELGERDGSHTGDLQVARERGASCPRCGSPMVWQTTGGRSTYWCPACAGVGL